MSATSRTYWFWSDWLGDQAVRRLTLAERGLWIDLLALAAVASPVGYVCDDKGRPLTHEEIARVTNAGSPVEVTKLITAIVEKGAASRDRTGRLYNRRMVREASVVAKRRLNGQAGGAATRLKWQALSNLPQQNAWQLPQPRAGPPFPISKKEREDSLLSHTAGLLATALPTGALARPPLIEQEEKKQDVAERRPPAQTSRAELEELFARKREKMNGHKAPEKLNGHEDRGAG
jgi:hypothetical protein